VIAILIYKAQFIFVKNFSTVAVFIAELLLAALIIVDKNSTISLFAYYLLISFVLAIRLMWI